MVPLYITVPVPFPFPFPVPVPIPRSYSGFGFPAFPDALEFVTEAQLTARVEQDKVSKDKVSSKQNDINKRSPLVLHEEPNAQGILPHRYITFINHWMNKILSAPDLDLARAGHSRAIESRGKTTC